jgi:hypothetical protein
MALVSLVEAFERFLKEMAAECVDDLFDALENALGRAKARP